MKLPKLSTSTGEFVVPEPGIYKMELLSYTEPTPSAFDPEKLRFSMTFAIVDDEEFEGAEVRQFFGYSMHAKSKLLPVIKALLGGAEVSEDDEIDLDDLIGKRIMGTVDVTEKPRTDGMGTARFANLVAAAPLKRKKLAEETAAPKRKSAWDDEEDAA